MPDKQLHILFLCSWYPNPENQSNGIFIKRHAQALAKKHRVTVLFVKSISNTEERTYVNVDDGNFTERCVFYPKVNSNTPILSSFLKLRKFKKEYKDLIDAFPKEKQFDVIHVNTIFPAAIPAMYALKKYPKANLFVTEHWSGYYSEDGNYKGFYLKRVTQKIVQKAKAVFVISDKLKIAMRSHGLNNKFELINNVVDTTVFKPMPSLKADDGVLKIVHVSSLVEREKNISGIIEVAKQLVAKNIKFTLTIIGENAQEIITHKNLVHHNQLHKFVLFVGYKTPTEIARFMNQSDIFLLLSHFEGMPVVLLEAMACGIPVITTPVGEIKNMVHPNMGIILKNNIASECVENLRNFNRADFALAEEMNQYIVNYYSMESVGNAITQLYHKYLN